MGFRRKIQYFLVHSLKYSNKEAQRLITEKKVSVNDQIINNNCLITENDSIKIDGVYVQEKKAFIYIKYNKPVGYISSLNANVKDSLFHRFKHQLPLFIAGRLDKQSEGLLLLTNDGKWAKEITDPGKHKEKKYVVQTDKPLTKEFLLAISSGVKILNTVTRACVCEQISETEFNIILTEGKNRQIRRMCYNNGYQVIKLKRLSIDNIQLLDLDYDKEELLKI